MRKPYRVMLFVIRHHVNPPIQPTLQFSMRSGEIKVSLFAIGLIAAYSLNVFASDSSTRLAAGSRHRVDSRLNGASIDVTIDETHHVVHGDLRIACDQPGMLNCESDEFEPTFFASTGPISVRTGEIAFTKIDESTDNELADVESKVAGLSVDRDNSIRPKTESRKATWPKADKLSRELEALAEYEISYEWATRTLNVLRDLEATEIDRLDLARLAMQQVESSVLDAEQLLRAIPPQHLQTKAWRLLFARILRTKYDLSRRLQGWTSVIDLMDSPLFEPNLPHPSAVVNSTLASMGQLRLYANHETWTEYFELERLEKFYSDDRFTEAHRQLVARKVLGRITSPNLTEEQQRFATEILGDRLIDQLRDISSQSVDVQKLLNTIEAYESDPQGASLFYMNSEFQNLYFSRLPQYQVAASSLDNIYRNANIRITVSRELINRALPTQAEANEPTTDRILGAQVFANNRIQNRIHVDFVPHPEQLHFRLMTNGTVFSRTRALHSGFTFHNSGNSRFEGISEITLTKQGLLADSARVSASTSQRLLGIRSNFDKVPLFGWAARQLAEQQQRSSAPIANRLVEEKLKNMTRSRVDEEISERLNQAQTLFLQQVITPLNLLELEPTPIELRTTQDEAIVRYRIAGRDQMAAFTARPEADPGNLFSMQIHESAINNLLGKININGKRFTAKEFVEHLRELIGPTDFMANASPAKNPDADFTFASIEGIHVAFNDDKLELSLNLAQLNLGKSQRWRNFTVTAIYIPRVNGLNIRFIQDANCGLRLGGSRLGIADEVSLRTVFNSTFPESFSVPPLTQVAPAHIHLADLEISQLVFSHGWVGVSLSKRESDSKNSGNRNEPRTGQFGLGRLLR